MRATRCLDCGDKPCSEGFCAEIREDRKIREELDELIEKYQGLSPDDINMGDIGHFFFQHPEKVCGLVVRLEKSAIHLKSKLKAAANLLRRTKKLKAGDKPYLKDALNEDIDTLLDDI